MFFIFDSILRTQFGNWIGKSWFKRSKHRCLHFGTNEEFRFGPAVALFGYSERNSSPSRVRVSVRVRFKQMSISRIVL